MNHQNLLQAIHGSEALRLCKISPKNREAERKNLAADVEKFLQNGKKITVLHTTQATIKSRAF